NIALTDGATGEVTLEPEEDRSALASGGQLALEVTESQPVVTIDGRARGVYVSPLHLVAGPHHLLVERGDFEPAEREVTIDPGRTTSVRVILEPTPEFRAHYIARAQAQRTWGLVSVIGGAAVLAGGIGLVVYDGQQRADGTAKQQSIVAQNVPGGPCDKAQDMGTTFFQMNCVVPLNAANAKVDDANTRDYFGWSAVGVGGVAMILGVVLLITSDDAHKYDTPKSAPDGTVTLHVTPTFWTTRGGGGAGLVGSF
ncbi:MAG TPA: PEGA domain-containing protein, partial [Polyangiaceae bacterium]|nr:PEGA domain-containing protein [Polyangiaceae bacterium]